MRFIENLRRRKAVNDSAKKRLVNFLESTPVPFAGSPQWNEWQEQCNRVVGVAGVPTLVEILKYERESLHYATIMALRMLGVQVGQVGEGPDTVYEIHFPQGTRIERFTPIHPPEAPRDIDDIDDDSNWDTRMSKGEQE